MTINSEKLKLKSDTFYLKTEKGVYFKNNRGSFEINGSSVYQLIELVHPLLNGKRSLEQILEQFSDKLKPYVNKIIEALIENGFIKDLNHEKEPHDKTIAERFPELIAFIDNHSDSASYRLEKFTQKKLLFIVDEKFYRPLFYSAIEYGIQTVDIIYIGDTTEQLHSETQADTTLNIIAQANRLSSTLLSDYKDYDAVVYAITDIKYDEIKQIRAYAGREDIPLYPAFIHGTQSYIGPSSSAESHSCMGCLYQWMTSDEVTSQGEPSDNLLYIISHYLLFGVFKDLTGLDMSDFIDQSYIIDNQQLTVDIEPISTHPSCQFCNKSSSELPIFVNESEITEQIIKLECSLFNPIIDFSPGDLPQAPLSQYSLLLNTQSSKQRVIGYGMTHIKAKLDTFFRGVECFLKPFSNHDNAHIASGIDKDSTKIKGILNAIAHHCEETLFNDKIQLKRVQPACDTGPNNHLLKLISKYPEEVEFYLAENIFGLSLFMLLDKTNQSVWHVVDSHPDTGIERLILSYLWARQNNQHKGIQKDLIELFEHQNILDVLNIESSQQDNKERLTFITEQLKAHRIHIFEKSIDHRFFFPKYNFYNFAIALIHE